MKRLAIIGAGDLGQLIAYHAENDKHYKISGFFDDYRKKDELVGCFPVLGNIEDVINCYNQGLFDELFIGIGYKHMEFRKKIFETFKQIIPFGSIIHSSSYIDNSCRIGHGTFILPSCALDRNVTIGENVLLNTGCIISHDSAINSHTFLSPGVTIAGFVRIEESCNIGINSTVIDNICITEGTQTGGGTVVIKNIEKAGLYVGNPAKFVR